MAKHNKVGEALETYRAKQRAKKVGSGQKERRIKKRADARAEATTVYLATESALAKNREAKIDADNAVAANPDPEQAVALAFAQERAREMVESLEKNLSDLRPAYEYAIRSEEKRLGMALQHTEAA